jgi:hypothetical protein
MSLAVLPSSYVLSAVIHHRGLPTSVALIENVANV